MANTRNDSKTSESPVEQPKVLIVESDENFAGILAKNLEVQGYSAMCVATAKSALSTIGVYPFDVALVEVRLTDMNGIQLLHHIKSMRSVPVILLGAASEFKNPKDATDVGAFRFVAKPFKFEMLVQILAQCLGDKAPKETADEGENCLDDEFCKLEIADFISGTGLQYDIYVRLSNKKYLKIAKKGDIFSDERIRAYQQKEVTHFHMRLSDFRNYVGMNINMAQLVKGSNTLRKEKKLQFMANVTGLVMTQLCLEGVNAETFENSKVVLMTTLSMMLDTADLLSALTVLQDHSNTLFAHSLAVSLHSTMICKALGWQSSQAIYKISMGGLLHDIGKKDIPEEILNKPSALLTSRERKILDDHPAVGAEILRKLGSMPSEIAAIAAQHHENCLGLGYPNQLKSSVIHPLAKVISVANEFCILALKNPNNPQALKPIEVLGKMSLAMSSALDRTAFEALAKVFKVKLAGHEQK